MGKIYFKKGYYYYIGSAMAHSGPNNLKNRVLRHLRLPEQKKRHWHIDYLLENKNLIFIKLFLVPSRIRIECNLAKEISDLSESFIENFGSSDCTCKSHLFYSNKLLKTLR